MGVGFVLGGWLGVAAGLGTAALVWRWIGRREPTVERRRREALAAALPHVVDLMASSLAAGAAPSRACELVAEVVDPPMCDELRLVAGSLAVGMDPVRVWTEVSRHPALGPMGRCLARAVDSGASVSEAMHRLAGDLRRRAQSEVEDSARAVGVKAAVPLGVCLLPAFLLLGVVPLVAGALQALVAG